MSKDSGSVIKIPNSLRQFVQPNNSDIAGNIYQTYGCDFVENIGAIRAGKRLLVNALTADDSAITGYPIGFRYFNNGSDSSYYMATGASGVGYAFKGGTVMTTPFSKVSTSGSPATIDCLTSDIETAFSELYISSAVDAKVYYLNGSNAWANLSAGSAGFAMMMTYFAFTDRMYVSKLGNLIQSWNSAHTVVSPTNAYALTLPTGTQITWLRASTNRIWIGTINSSGGKGKVYEWNGIATTFTKEYRLESAGALACVIKGDLPWVMDADGNLLALNGGTFQKVAGLNRKVKKPLFNAYYSTNQRFIHPNGMGLVQGRINLVIDGTYFDVANHNGTQEVTIPSGVWEYDPDVGLYHKHWFGLTKVGAMIQDHGQIRIYGAGAINEISTAQSVITTDGQFFAGASVFIDATGTPNTNTSGAWYNNSLDTIQKYFSFITPKLYSQNIDDVWHKFYVRHKRLLDTTDKIVVKYRVTDLVPTEATITWVNTTSFTVLASAFTTNPAAGDEVEVVQGDGSGKCSHIIVVSGTTTLTITVDETYTGITTNTAKARFLNWTKLGSQTSQSENFKRFSLDTPSTWVQFKVCGQFIGADEITDLISTSQVQTPVI